MGRERRGRQGVAGLFPSFGICVSFGQSAGCKSRTGGAGGLPVLGRDGFIARIAEGGDRAEFMGG
jgi:hypothetical protein